MKELPTNSEGDVQYAITDQVVGDIDPKTCRMHGKTTLVCQYQGSEIVVPKAYLTINGEIRRVEV